MWKTLKDLGLALINATLILIALCLFLAWNVAKTADQITTTFAQNLISIEPLREDIQGATSELTALRGDVANLKTQSGELNSAGLRMIETRLEQMEIRLGVARQSITDLTEAPKKLIDYAIDQTGNEIVGGLNDIRGCVPPGPSS